MGKYYSASVANHSRVFNFLRLFRSIQKKFLPTGIVMLGILFTPSPTPATAQVSNLISNPSFESDFSNWNHRVRPETAPSTAQIISGTPCHTSKCAQLVPQDAEWQALVQLLTGLPANSYYHLSVWFKATAQDEAYFALHDLDWKDSTGNIVGKTFSKKIQGNGDWLKANFHLYLPVTDDSGEDISTHRWYVYLYAHAASQIYYDDVELKLIPTPLPSNVSHIDETLWEVRCQKFSDGYPLNSCPAGLVTSNTQDFHSGASALVVSSLGHQQVSLNQTIPVKPLQKYRVTASVQLKNWKTFNYLSLDYPSLFTQDNPDLRDHVDDTKGIWSGIYSLTVNGQNIVSPRWWKTPMVSPDNLPWFTETYYFETNSTTHVADLSLQLQGLEGQVYIDNLHLEEVTSTIDDHYFSIPIETEYAGMKLTAVNSNPLTVTTNAAVFSFAPNTLTISKSNTPLTVLNFANPILNGLNQQQLAGSILLENDYAKISIGADSVLLFKLKSSQDVDVTGTSQPYSLLEAGVLFATDHQKGILFSPIRTPYEIESMPYQQNPADLSYSYSDPSLESAGLKNWQVISDLTNPNWNIRYHFTTGDGFLLQAFPPKDFNLEAFCQQRVNVATLYRHQYPQADLAYNIQSFSQRHNVALLWPNDYAYSANQLDPPTQYCEDSLGSPVDCQDPTVHTRVLLQFIGDINTNFDIYQPSQFQTAVSAFQAQGVKVIIYLTPEYYYTANVDQFIQHLQHLVNTYNLDGVYLDGLYARDALKSLELVRKVRNVLGDKVYVQHNSWTRGLIYATHRFRIPFQDAYADVVWVGEGIKSADQDIWKVNYCGQNVSNTASILLPELRPVNYSLDRQSSLNLALSPLQQINSTLACQGAIRTTNSYSSPSLFEDKRLQYHQAYDSVAAYQALDTLCAPITCGNNQCNLGESIVTCSQDCAQESPDKLISKGDSAACLSQNPVVQWVVEGTLFFSLHFTFDDSLASDHSGTQHNLSQFTGISAPATTLVTSEGRSAHRFDGTSILTGPKDANLNLNGSDFSALARFKPGTSQSSGYQALFAYGPRAHFSVGLLNQKAYAVIRNAQDQAISLQGTSTLPLDQWHSIALVYASSTLSLYVNGVKEGETQINPAPFPAYDPYAIGSNGQDQHFYGLIDDLILSPQALTSTQINQYHQSSITTINNPADQIFCITNSQQGYQLPKVINVDLNQDNVFDFRDSAPLLQLYDLDNPFGLTDNPLINLFDYHQLIRAFSI